MDGRTSSSASSASSASMSSTGPTAQPLRSLVREPGPAMTRFVVRVLRPVMRMIARYDWRGLDRVPRSGGVIVAPNHISNFDPITISHFCVFAGRWPYFLAKESLFRAPLIGFVMRASKQIPVHRATTDASLALASAQDALTAGRCLIIYPEGTVTADPHGWPGAGKTGTVRLALETGCPLVPVGQWGAQRVLGMKRISWPRLIPRPTIRVYAGAPVDLADLRGPDAPADRVAIAHRRLMAAIADLVEQARGETRPAAERTAPTDPGAA